MYILFCEALNCSLLSFPSNCVIDEQIMSLCFQLFRKYSEGRSMLLQLLVSMISPDLISDNSAHTSTGIMLHQCSTSITMEVIVHVELFSCFCLCSLLWGNTRGTFWWSQRNV